MGTITETQFYFLVENPEKKKRVILATDKHVAIQVAVEMDKFFWENWEYKCVKSKI